MATTQSPIAFRADSEVRITDSERVQAVLDAVEDSKCRDVLKATDSECLTASDVSQRCELPVSTTYRKLDTLTDAGLLAERTRIDASGTHVSEYQRRFDDLTVTMGENGFEIELTYEEQIQRQSSLVVEAD
jgi:Fe2+ or Zn2+ uptake regulation protein